MINNLLCFYLIKIEDNQVVMVSGFNILSSFSINDQYIDYIYHPTYVNSMDIKKLTFSFIIYTNKVCLCFEYVLFDACYSQNFLYDITNKSIKNIFDLHFFCEILEGYYIEKNKEYIYICNYKYGEIYAYKYNETSLIETNNFNISECEKIYN